jgi:hypothetical protein
MGQRARVTSIDAVDDFAAALRCFQHEASTALETLQLKIHRAVQWIEYDQKKYWTRQLRRSEQQVQEAKIDLQRCLTFKRIGDHRPACIEEKRALERAKRRQQVCREKLEAVRKWSRAIVRAVFEYKAGVGELSGWLQSDAERAVALLERISQTLQQYVAAESSPQLAEALTRLPWTNEQWEPQEQEDQAAEKDSAEEPGPAADANDGTDASRGREHGSEEGVSS